MLSGYKYFVLMAEMITVNTFIYLLKFNMPMIFPENNFISIMALTSQQQK